MEEMRLRLNRSPREPRKQTNPDGHRDEKDLSKPMPPSHQGATVPSGPKPAEADNRSPPVGHRAVGPPGPKSPRASTAARVQRVPSAVRSRKSGEKCSRRHGHGRRRNPEKPGHPPLRSPPRDGGKTH